MSARPTHDLVIKVGEYDDRETGETKARWLTIGTVFRHDEGGTSIKLDCLPVGLPDWNGWVSVFPRDRDGRGTGGQPQGQGQTRPQGRAPQQGEQGGYSNMGQGQRNQGRGQTPPPKATFDDDIPF